MSRSTFDLDVTFTGNNDGNILTPLGVPDHRELRSGTTNNQDGVAFAIDVRNSGVDRLVATITAASGRVYQEQLAAPLTAAGRHHWRWDGYGTNRILDTRLLKDPSLALELVADGGGVSYPASGEIDLMKHYHGPRPSGFFSRLSASEQDVKSLVWMARVRFDA